MRQLGRIATIFIIFLSGTSCGMFSGEGSEGIVEKSLSPVNVSEASVETMGLASAREVSPEALDGRLLDNYNGETASLLDIRVFQFAYDSSEILEKHVAAIEGHARYLIKNSNTRVILEGHTDERGSREYNLALGERRAQSLQRRLSLLGVPESQMSVITYGEERPIALMHNEAAYTVNRRVELVYR
jgi:peptidoglycan-associated lipoprotein